MKAVKVQYTVQPEYVEQNKSNIRKVMDALKANPIEGMVYATYTLEDDGQTFIHINVAKDGATLSQLNELTEFQQFRIGLKESNPIAPPVQVKLEPVGMSFQL